MPSRFVVPQFIEEENKIFLSVTTRQFLIVIIAVVVELIVFRISTPAFIVSIFIFFAPALVLAFVKINGQPFHLFLLNLIQSFKRPNLRVWNKNISLDELKFQLEREKNAHKKTIEKQIFKVKPTSSRLTELALIVDTGGMYKGE
ncbi:MAG TPA: PrgI family protein [bacterium]|nr:PrgI family protein [bacterium]